MASILDESTDVPAVDEKVVTVNPGDLWPLPNRGSRYTIKGIDGRPMVCWTRLDVKHEASRLPSGLLRAMGKYRGDRRGRFVVTPYGEVIARREIKDGVWRSVYVGKLDGVLGFPGFELDPSGLKTGNLWPGLHFIHGEGFAVWNRAGNQDYLYWTRRGRYFRTIEKYPDICAEVRRIRPRCGRIYVTENGYIWMNLPSGEVSKSFQAEFHALLTEDKKVLTDGKHDILLRSIHNRVKATNCLPVYLGKMPGFDSGCAPRTHFLAETHFGLGGEDAYDGDNFGGKSWRRMKRDI